MPSGPAATVTGNHPIVSPPHRLSVDELDSGFWLRLNKKEEEEKVRQLAGFARCVSSYLKIEIGLFESGTRHGRGPWSLAS